MIAFCRPPPAVPGAGVLAVNIAQLIDEKPLINNTLKIHNRKNMPMIMASIHRVNAMPLMLFLFASIDFLMLNASLMI